MPDHNISKAQPSKAKGLGGVLTIRSKNAALLYLCVKTFTSFTNFCNTENTGKIGPKLFLYQLYN